MVSVNDGQLFINPMFPNLKMSCPINLLKMIHPNLCSRTHLISLTCNGELADSLLVHYRKVPALFAMRVGG